jgi:hypothetical protein
MVLDGTTNPTGTCQSAATGSSLDQLRDRRQPKPHPTPAAIQQHEPQPSTRLRPRSHRRDTSAEAITADTARTTHSPAQGQSHTEQSETRRHPNRTHGDSVVKAAVLSRCLVNAKNDTLQINYPKFPKETKRPALLPYRRVSFCFATIATSVFRFWAFSFKKDESCRFLQSVSAR